MKREIFPNKIRSSSGGFAVRFHYPGQMVTSERTEKRTWNAVDNITDFELFISVNQMETNIHRYKTRYDNCVQDWKSYDKFMIQRHIDNLGCKFPLYGNMYHGNVCMNEKDHKRAEISTSYLRGNSKPPCREIESVDYTINESVGPARFKTGPEGQYNYNYFTIILAIQKSYYRAIIQKKEVDFQTLIGYIGGYIGIFTGFAARIYKCIYIEMVSLVLHFLGLPIYRVTYNSKYLKYHTIALDYIRLTFTFNKDGYVLCVTAYITINTCVKRK